MVVSTPWKIVTVLVASAVASRPWVTAGGIGGGAAGKGGGSSGGGGEGVGGGGDGGTEGGGVGGGGNGGGKGGGEGRGEGGTLGPGSHSHVVPQTGGGGEGGCGTGRGPQSVQSVPKAHRWPLLAALPVPPSRHTPSMMPPGVDVPA